MLLNTQKYHLLSLLLARLEAEHYPMGVGKQLQLQELMHKLPADLPPEALKTKLAPLFTTNKEEQDHFYELFDACWADVQELGKTVPPAPPPIDKSRPWWYLFLLLLVITALAVGGVYYWLQEKELEPGKAYNRNLPVFRLDSSFQRIDLQREDTLRYLSFADGQQTGVDTVFGNYELDSIGYNQYNFIFRAADTIGTLRLDVYARYSPEVTDTFRYTVNITEPPVEPPTPPDTLKIPEKEIPYPHDIADLSVDANQQRLASLWEKYGAWIKALLISLLAAILWVLVRYLARRRQKLVAEIESRDQPPYVWNIHLDQQRDIVMEDQLQGTLNQMRQRQEAGYQHLDVPATIRASINKGGRITFAYREQTRPPEYLFLIDRHAYNDHRARLFDALYQSFKANEVYAERFFYDGDPRLCFNEAHPYGINLKELQHRYLDARLLIMGSGHHLLSPLNNKLSKWTAIFRSWKERAILSTRPASVWGRREANLSELFNMAPASLPGIEWTLDQFEAEESTDYTEVLATLKTSAPKPINLKEQADLIATLRAHFDESLIRWIAACAIYPSLHWDLTLQLGQLLTPQDTEPLVSLGNLEVLFRLPWFIEGKIPDEARQQLLHYLEEIGQEKALRQQLDQLLQEAPKPDADAIAYDEYRMNIVINKLLFVDDEAERKKLETEFREYLAAGHDPDFVIFKYLDRPRNRIDFVVPESWKPFIYPEGRPFFGWKDWTWAVTVWLLLSAALIFGWKPVFETCEDPLSYGSLQLCLQDMRDTILYKERLILDAIENEQLPQADSTMRADSLLFLRDTIQTDTLFKNVAAAAYRKGARLFNGGLEAGAAIGTDWQVLTDSLRNTACPYFAFAYRYDLIDPLHRDQLQACPPSFRAAPEQETSRIATTFDNLIREAEALENQGEEFWPAAIDRYRQALSLNYNNSLVQEKLNTLNDEIQRTFARLVEEGDTFAAAGACNEATEKYERALYLDPGNAEVLQKIEACQDTSVPSTTTDSDGDGLNDGDEVNTHQTDPNKADTDGDGVSDGAEITNGSDPLDNADRPAVSIAQLNLDSLLEISLLDDGQLENILNYLNDNLDQLNASDRNKVIDYLQSLESNQKTYPLNSRMQIPFGQLKAKLGLEEVQASPDLPIPEMVRVTGGEFTMGCTEEQGEDCLDREKPPHTVRVDDFSIGRYEVTNEEFAAFLNDYGSDEIKTGDYAGQKMVYEYRWGVQKTDGNQWQPAPGYEKHPIVNVTWYGAYEYCRWLSQKTNRPFRLPTEAEWEFAARGGLSSQQYKYSGSNDLDEVAWYLSNSNSTTHQVGNKNPNELGLYDMSGNVYEWCQDWYGENYYAESPQDNPAGPATGTYRVLRGGSWDVVAAVCRVAIRDRDDPDNWNVDYGFRVAQD